MTKLTYQKQQGKKQGGSFPRSTEAEGARHRRNHRNFKESDSTDQNADRLKHHPPPPKEVVTRNFFAPVKAADMDTDASGTEANSKE
jgi:hypothetical protein